MSSLFAFASVLCWALSIAGIAWYCLNVARQLTYVTLADGRQQERKLPFTFRILLPFTGNLKNFILHNSGFAKARAQYDAKLITAGFEGLLSGWEFIALRIIQPIFLGFIWVCLFAFLASIDDVIKDNLATLIMLGFLLFLVQPTVWLNYTIKKRQMAILRAMPFMIDLLTLSVEAGIDFMNALQRSIEQRKMDPLTEELIQVVHEIQLGSPRRVALRNLSKRVDMPDMRSFAYSLIQADDLGVSIGTILRIQAAQIRQKRFDRAERLANEAPVKMLGPLMLFIFPAVFIVLLGPILARVAGNLM